MTMLEDPSSPITRAIGALSKLTVIAEAIVGYRKKLLEGGISNEAADEMCKEFHTALIGLFVKGASK